MDEVAVNLDGQATLTARIGFAEVSRALLQTEVDDLNAQIDKLNLPQLPIGALDGVDGVTYHLRLSAGTAMVEYSWWSAPPKGWAPLKKLADRLISLSGLKAPSSRR